MAVAHLASTMIGIVGRWLGPALMLLAVYLFFFPPMPFVDTSQGAALAAGALTGIACIFLRAPAWQRRRKILAIAALAAFTFAGWRHWELRRGYHEETVSFDNRGARLVGTLYIPNGSRKRAAIVFLAGSGAIPRGWFGGYVTHFAREGYVVLVYDKRGAGDSSGTFQAGGYFDLSWNLELLADDAAAGAAFLASRPEVRSDGIGFVGLSEGGLITPRAAELSGKTRFMLVLTSTTASVYRHGLFQLTNRGWSVERAEAEIQRYFASDFDPGPSLRALNVPGLWVLAEQDTRNPNRETVRIIESLQQSGKPYEYRIIPGAGHGLFFGPKRQTLDTIDRWLAETAGPS